jgi:hypothetical protein
MRYASAIDQARTNGDTCPPPLLAKIKGCGLRRRWRASARRCSAALRSARRGGCSPTMSSTRSAPTPPPSAAKMTKAIQYYDEAKAFVISVGGGGGGGGMTSKAEATLRMARYFVRLKRSKKVKGGGG